MDLRFARERAERLMTSACEVHTSSTSKNSKGIAVKTYTKSYVTRCRFKTMSQKSSVFADKAGSRTVYQIRLPILSLLHLTDGIKIDGKLYEVLGIYDETHTVERILEAVLNE